MLNIRYFILKLSRKYKSLAPGPIGLPLLGSLLSLAKDEKSFYNLLASYGPISLFYIGNKKVFMLNDPKIASKLLKNENCLSRAKIDPKFNGKYEMLDDDIVMMEYGKKWNYVSFLPYFMYSEL